jgi:hypothetical protein
MKTWKLQKFASDVIYDMRSRNLLPLAILLVVAIVAVPFVLGGSGSEPAPSTNAAATSEPAPEAQSAVLAYSPEGVRDYRKRLQDLQAKNPFRQQFAAPSAAAASSLGTTVEEITGGGTGGGGGEVPSTGDTGDGSTGGGGGGGGKKKKTKTKTRYASYETDVLVGETGGTLTQMQRIQQFTLLPSDQVPVLVFLGVTTGGSQAIFLVAKDVASVGGAGTCFPSAESCQLLGLNTGASADAIYTPDGKTYHLQVLRIKRVLSSKPPN